MLKKIEQFDSSLRVRYYQTIYKDVYGNYINDKWDKEKKYFFEKNLYSLLLKIPSGDDRAKAVEQCWKHIDTVATKSINVKVEADVASSVRQLNKGMNPNDYERFCAELLRKSGSEARVTKASNDQGCDIVATKNGRKLVVQCKLYSSPVGNSAVQEISASRLHEQADFAAVVSNAAFTKPARQLANTNNVMLLHHDQLPSLEKEIAELSTQTV